MSTLFGKKKSASRKRARESESQCPKESAEQHDEREVDVKEQELSPWCSFEDLGLAAPLVRTCRSLGFTRPTPVQRRIVPFLIQDTQSNVLALAATGSGKTASFVLPVLQHLSEDPYDFFGVILSPTRELTKQIHQHAVALGAKSYGVRSALVVGGLDAVQQSCELARLRPHLVVATPGRFAALLRGPDPPRLHHVRYLVLDEADRLLTSSSGFERDVAEILMHCNHPEKVGKTPEEIQAMAATEPTESRSKSKSKCQTLLFSATMTQSLSSLEEIASAGQGRMPIKKFIISNDDVGNDLGENDGEKTGDIDGQSPESDTPKIPAGLKQEYIFMPSRVRDAYLLTVIRTLMSNGGRAKAKNGKSLWTTDGKRGKSDDDDDDNDDEDNDTVGKACSAIVFVSTCERAALVSGILTQVGVENVALHSLLTSQGRRLAALAKFQSQHVRVLVATDVASRGLDVPCVDLVINAELPRAAVSYVHRVGRTARAGRRGRAVSLVGENDVSLVHVAERVSGRALEKCADVTDDAAIKMLGPVTKAARLAKQQLMDIGFDELVQKFKERKVRDRKERQRIERALRKQVKKQKKSET